MVKEIMNKHDAAFKQTFSQKRIAKDFLENNLPQEVLDIIDMNTMELARDSFEDEKFKEFFSDLIYNVKINNKDAYICFLFEHKSTRDKLTIFQLNKYILEIWISAIQKEEKSELPIVLPVVVYHGLGKWNFKTDLRDMIPNYHDLPKYIKERVPAFKYDLYNIGQSGDEDFEKYARLTAMMLTAFKFSYEKDIEIVLEEFLIILEKTLEEESMDELMYFVRIYFNYIQQTHIDIPEKELLDKIKKIQGREASSMSLLERNLLDDILEKTIEKGMKEGLEKGLEKGMEKGRQEEKIKIAKNCLKEGTEIALIAKITGLSEEEVEKLKEEM